MCALSNEADGRVHRNEVDGCVRPNEADGYWHFQVMSMDVLDVHIPK